ncbi:hypothetical protein nbrc107696_07900 [Gordonia spumicola]|uniref:Flippase n=1 Tax=Gordonia spumicola TaxID=589161 RepID=A0A7I9V590_9ACTN|nr:hypothetical protein nbrc107696_07900 [Gordonia spumicola]
MEPTEVAVDSSLSKRAVSNTIAMLVSRVGIAAMGWLGTILIARSLSSDDFGKFSFVFGVLGMMAVVTDLGVGRVVLARLVGDDEDQIARVAASFVWLRLALGLIGYAVALAVVVVTGHDGDVIAATAIAGLVVVIATPSHALTVIFQSRLRLGLVAAGEVAAQGVQLLLTIAAVLFAPLLLVLVIPAIANELVSLGVKARALLRGADGPAPRGGIDGALWREMLIEAVPLSIGLAFVEVTAKVDVLLLGRMDTFDAVGLYSIGFKFSDFIGVACVAVVTPFTTLLVASWPGDHAGFRHAARRAAAIISALCAVGVAALYPVADDLLRFLYGDRFAVAAQSTRLLVIAASMGALAHLGIMILVAVGSHRVYPWLTLTSLCLNIGLNLWLIPRASYLGSSWAMVVSEAFLLVAVIVLVAVSLPVKRVLSAVHPLRATAVAATVITFTMMTPGVEDSPWPVRAILGGAGTLVVLHLCGGTDGFSIRAQVGRLRDRRSMSEG